MMSSFIATKLDTTALVQKARLSFTRLNNQLGTLLALLRQRSTVKICVRR